MEYLNLLSNLIIAICALYLSYMALMHSARPKIKITLESTHNLFCDEKSIFEFSLKNVGNWYAKPMVIALKVYVIFDPQFEPIELFYGSTLEIHNTKVAIGVGERKYLKATGIMLSYGEEPEKIQAIAKNPNHPGKYLVRIIAYSENGVSIKKDFKLNCTIKSDS